MKQKRGMITKSLGDGRYMVIPIEGENVNRILSLNGSGGFVWKLLETEHSFEELVMLVEKEYDIPAVQAREDLEEFLDEIQSYITNGKD